MATDPPALQPPWRDEATLSEAVGRVRSVVAEGSLADVVRLLAEIERARWPSMVIALQERRVPPFRYEHLEFPALIAAQRTRRG